MKKNFNYMLHIGFLCTGFVLLCAALWKYHADMDVALGHYRAESHEQSAIVALRVQDTFRQMYEGMRTMARLPGVRSIDRYAKNFDGNARGAVQEIYNNLGSSVMMSEIYIVPLDLEPDQIDRVTKKLQTPITTFDQIILNKNADKKEEEESGVEEIEIYEYRLEKKQLAWFKQNFPAESLVGGLKYPAICGPEVITCDNSRYSPARPDDKDRSGLVYAVPFYAPDGKLKGSVTSILLTHALRDMLPDSNYVVRNVRYDYNAVPNKPGIWQTSDKWIAHSQPDPDLLYSETLRLPIQDNDGQWLLWAGQPNAVFYARNDVQAARQFAIGTSACVILLVFGMFSIAQIIHRNRAVEEAKKHSENLEILVSERTDALLHQAFHDPLTGLPNRAKVLHHLKLIAEKQQNGGKAVLFLDLDNFKFINDSLGHKAGDELLIAASQRLQKCVRPEDMVARLGGDEFLIVMQAVPQVEAAIQVAQRVLDCMKVGVALCGGEGFTSASVGIAYTVAASFDPDILVRDADTAMYQAKLNGKSAYALFEAGMNDRMTERVEMEVGLRLALEQQQFCVHYQPLIDLKTGRLTGAEALVRWQHPVKGLIAPGKFIPIAEDTGLIAPLGYWVLEQACRQALIWMETYSDHGVFTMNVNLSGKQLQKPDVVERVRAILKKTGLPAEYLKLEITESVMMEDVELAVTKLKALKALGVKLALDDFGTGYSSMASLSSFPLDTVKIDRAFVNHLTTDADAASVIAAIIMLAKSLDIDVTGEGIETPEQVTSLQGLGCDIGQGFFFGRPQTAEALEERMTGKGSLVISNMESDKMLIERLLSGMSETAPESLPGAA